MASFQEGQACTVAGMAHSTASTTSTHFIAAFFMTIFLVPLFYKSRSSLGACLRLVSVPLTKSNAKRKQRKLKSQYGEYRWYSIQYTTTPVTET